MGNPIGLGEGQKESLGGPYRVREAKKELHGGLDGSSPSPAAEFWQAREGRVIPKVWVWGPSSSFDNPNFGVRDGRMARRTSAGGISRHQGVEADSGGGAVVGGAVDAGAVFFALASRCASMGCNAARASPNDFSSSSSTWAHTFVA